MSDMRSLQQSNLLHLNSLQNQTKSLTAADYPTSSFQKRLVNKQQFLQNMSPLESVDTSINLHKSQETLVKQDSLKPQHTTFQNINSDDKNYTYDINTNNISKKKNSFTKSSFYNRIRNSLHATSLLQQEKLRATLQKQVNQTNKDIHSPLVVLIPTTAQPTVLLVERFTAWRSIIKSLIVYLTEIASVQDEIVRQQLRLVQIMKFPFANNDSFSLPLLSNDEKLIDGKFFAPVGNGSIRDVPEVLKNYHQTMAVNASQMSKELLRNVIPRLQSLKADLLIKIKEIKSIQSDFSNSCDKEVQATKQMLYRFQKSVQTVQDSSTQTNNSGIDRSGAATVSDPFLNKLALDKQIKRQLKEENLLHEAFDNLQDSGSQLEKAIFMEIQNAITIFVKLLGEQSQIVFDTLITKIDDGFLNINPQFEWNTFIDQNPNFISGNIPMRHFKDIEYKFQDNLLTYAIRSGYIRRRSSILKTYTKSFYVLTAIFLHEFKTDDIKHNPVPTLSIPLSKCKLKDVAMNKSDSKLVIYERQSGVLSKKHSWNFRFDSLEEATLWYNDIKRIVSSQTLDEKVQFINEKGVSAQPVPEPLDDITERSVLSDEDNTLANTSENKESMTGVMQEKLASRMDIPQIYVDNTYYNAQA